MYYSCGWFLVVIGHRFFLIFFFRANLLKIEQNSKPPPDMRINSLSQLENASPLDNNPLERINNVCWHVNVVGCVLSHSCLIIIVTLKQKSMGFLAFSNCKGLQVTQNTFDVLVGLVSWRGQDPLCQCVPPGWCRLLEKLHLMCVENTFGISFCNSFISIKKGRYLFCSKHVLHVY